MTFWANEFQKKKKPTFKKKKSWQIVCRPIVTFWAHAPTNVQSISKQS